MATGRLGVLALILIFHAGRASAAPPAIDGDYDSPLGRVRISGAGIDYRGVLIAPSSLCPLAKGAVVLEATLLDDSLAGRMRVCLVGPGCTGKTDWASAVLLVGPGQLSGAVHVEGAGCAAPFGKKGGVTLARAGKGTPKRAPRPGQDRRARDRLARVRALLTDGKAYLDEGNFEAARKRFTAAIAADPGVPEAYNGVGVTYRMRNALPDALAWYKKALEADPDFGDAYYNMACVYALQGEMALALRYLQIAALNGYQGAEGLDADPDLAALRDEPAYRALVKAHL
jgi:tetratricopeptide (TPR) repeat protein